MLNYHHLRYFWAVAHEGSVSRAAKRLRITQPTISGQLRELQEQLGEPLFRRSGRSLELTDVGRATLVIADEIFALGDQLVETVKGKSVGRPLRLAVGLSDAVPKRIAHQILAPVVDERIQISCREGTPNQLLADLASHQLDIVISDAPSHASGTHEHLLGECGLGVFGVAKLAKEVRHKFPRSLDGAPFLLPSTNTGTRRELDAWFARHEIRPRVIGEFEDAALLAVFADAGAGLCVAPDLDERTLVRAGQLSPLRAAFYAITVERRLAHPAVALVANAAKLFSSARRAGRGRAR